MSTSSSSSTSTSTTTTDRTLERIRQRKLLQSELHRINKKSGLERKPSSFPFETLQDTGKPKSEENVEEDKQGSDGEDKQGSDGEDKQGSDGWDLELPTLDTYAEECVVFPSSPELRLHSCEGKLDFNYPGSADGEEEDDISAYKAILSPDYKEFCSYPKVKRGTYKPSPPTDRRRRIKVTADILHGHSSDEGESSALNISPLAELEYLEDPMNEVDVVQTPDTLEDTILERLGEPPPMPANTALLTRCVARNIDEARLLKYRTFELQGEIHQIDMKVLEPYTRVLSHGGCLEKLSTQPDVVIFSACFLPDRSRVDYEYVMDNLFMYVLTTMNEYIKQDYMLVYLHGATQRSCFPTFIWLKRCYQLIDRRLRKNLKGLFLVHPTFWLKTIVVLTKPFISSKFSRKLRFIDSLAELAAVVPIDQSCIPDRVKQLDDVLEEQATKRRNLLNSWWTQPPSTTTVSS